MNKKVLAVILVAIGGLFVAYKFIMTPSHNPSEIKDKTEQAAAKGHGSDTAGGESKDYQKDANNNSPNEELIKNYTAAIANDPNDGNAFYQRALVYQRIGKYSFAADDFSEVIRINPKAGDAYFNRGLMYALRSDIDNALKDFSAAIKLRPKDARIYNGRGLMYVEKGDLGAAEKDYIKAVTLDTKYGKAYFNLGTLYERQKKMKEAKAEYDLAIQYNADNLEQDDPGMIKQALLNAYYRRAIVQLDLANPQAALDDVNFVIGQDAKMIKAYQLRSAIYNRMGNTAGAAADEATVQNLGMEKILK